MVLRRMPVLQSFPLATTGNQTASNLVLNDRHAGKSNPDNVSTIKSQQKRCEESE